MCNAFRSISIAKWFCLDTKRNRKPRWSNKCPQHCVLKLCEGHAQRHGQRLFNRRCGNDSTIGFGSFKSMENIVAVKAFPDMHDYHVTILEPTTNGQCEEFKLGSGVHSIGTLLWDAKTAHASVVRSDFCVNCFDTCVSSEPWTRSAVGTGSSTHTLPSNMKLFKPLNSAPEIHPDGYFIIDSFHYFKNN